MMRATDARTGTAQTYMSSIMRFSFGFVDSAQPTPRYLGPYAFTWCALHATHNGLRCPRPALVAWVTGYDGLVPPAVYTNQSHAFV